MIDSEFKETKVFKPFDANNHGLFVLARAMFVDESKFTVQSGRCDNLNYAPIGLAWNPETNTHFGATWFSLKNLGNYKELIDAAPDFFVLYFELYKEDGIFGKLGTPAPEMETHNPLLETQTWVAKSLGEWLRLTYEWSKVTEEPWSNTQAIATHSKRFFEIMEMPSELYQEIEGMPDMHVFRYLKGDQNARTRPTEFPNVSNAMKEWFSAKMDQHSHKELEERF
jgi:hypothetical protein